MLAGSVSGQVKFKSLERATAKWMVPVANFQLPDRTNWVMAYMTLPAAMDSADVTMSISNITGLQDSLNTKAKKVSPVFSTSINGSYLTPSEILITDGSKNIVSAPVATYPSLTELTHLKGVTSSVQTQISAKYTLPSLTSGSVLFSNGSTIVQDNSNLFYDNSLDFFGVGTASPAYKLDVNGEVRVADLVGGTMIFGVGVDANNQLILGLLPITQATTPGGDIGGNYSSLQIGTGVVGQAEIAANGVAASEIESNAVGNSEMADNAIGSSEIIDGSVGAAELASSGVTAASYTNANITVNGDGIVTAASNGTHPNDSTLVGDTPMLDLTMTGKTISGIPDTVTYLATKHDISNFGDGDALVYRAIMTQTGADAPTAVILKNTLIGEPVWFYNTTGDYTAELSDGFTGSVPNINIFIYSENHGGEIRVISGSKIGESNYNIKTYAGTTLPYTPTDEILNNTLIEIWVLPTP